MLQEICSASEMLATAARMSSTVSERADQAERRGGARRRQRGNGEPRHEPQGGRRAVDQGRRAARLGRTRLRAAGSARRTACGVGRVDRARTRQPGVSRVGPGARSPTPRQRLPVDPLLRESSDGHRGRLRRHARAAGCLGDHHRVGSPCRHRRRPRHLSRSRRARCPPRADQRPGRRFGDSVGVDRRPQCGDRSVRAPRRAGPRPDRAPDRPAVLRPRGAQDRGLSCGRRRRGRRRRRRRSTDLGVDVLRRGGLRRGAVAARRRSHRHRRRQRHDGARRDSSRA